MAPFLTPESLKIQFDSANSVLITDRVAVVDNWTYGIKVVMGDHEKKDIEVTSGLQDSVHVLGGDVLAIPMEVPEERAEHAIKLIEQLVGRETQHVLAKKLVWAPVRQDVFNEIISQDGPQKKYLQAIWDALQTSVMRPLTPDWRPSEAVLSETLGKVLEQGAKEEPDAKGEPDAKRESDDDAIFAALFREFIEKWQSIPHEIVPCPVVDRASIPGNGSCPVGVPTDKSSKDIAPNFKTGGAILAAINGYGDELAIVSPKRMKILLVPKN